MKQEEKDFIIVAISFALMILSIIIMALLFIPLASAGYFNNETIVNLDYINSSLTFSNEITFDSVMWDGNYIDFTNVVCLYNSNLFPSINFTESNTNRDINYYCSNVTIPITPPGGGGGTVYCYNIINKTCIYSSNCNLTSYVTESQCNYYLNQTLFNITQIKNEIEEDLPLFSKSDFIDWIKTNWIAVLCFLLFLLILIILFIILIIRRKKKNE